MLLVVAAKVQYLPTLVRADCTLSARPSGACDTTLATACLEMPNPCMPWTIGAIDFPVGRKGSGVPQNGCVCSCAGPENTSADAVYMVDIADSNLLAAVALL
jgi:hypothetical protein